MVPSLPSILSTSSSAAGRVEKATSRLLIAPDWMMNMDICDSINSDPWQAKAFVKAVKKRLQNKNSKVQLLALTLLETMIKNCGDFVHFQVADRGILQEMVKMVRKTRNMQVREKILVLLESWQVALGGPHGKYPLYYYTYAELKRSGVRFPENRKESDLIFAPNTPTTNQKPNNSVERLGEAMASETGHFSSSDLHNVRTVVELFSNMLQAVSPKNNEAIKDEVITDLANQCRINQKKLLQLINSTEDDGLLGEALMLNDNLRIVLAKHDALASGSSSLPETTNPLPRPSSPPPALAMIQLEDKEEEEEEGEEEEEDGFSHIAKRHSTFKLTGDQEVSQNRSDTKTSISATSESEGSSSIASNALILFDPPSPVSSSKKEGNMIDLLSLALSADQSPQIPPVPSPPPSNQNQNPFSVSPRWEQFHDDSRAPVASNFPQPLMSNEGYIAYNNSYVAPWAQPAIVRAPEASPLFPQQVPQYPSNYLPQQQLPQYPSNYLPQQQLPQYPSNYLPQSWTTHGGTSTSFLLTSSIQYPASQSTMALAPATVTITAKDSKDLQKFSPFGSKETQVNADLKQAGTSNAPRQYMPDKLFEDLIDLRNLDGSIKSKKTSTMWGLSGQGMISGKS